MLAQQILSNLFLPFIPIAQQLFLIVQQFFMGFRGEFKVGSLDDCIDGTGLLAISTINTLGHINIISSSPPRPVLPLLGIDRNRLRRTRRLAKLARDATLLSRGITTQSVFAAKAGREVSLFVGVVDGYLGFHGDLAGEPEGTPDFGHEEDFGGAFEDVFPGCGQNIIPIGHAHVPSAAQGGSERRSVLTRYGTQCPATC
mmetsp:Transcript_10164/g.18254  ORF Transcript_10164/g.18254 Transcript_10164/m.18254 type:complete len:200 (-) Transcript_10164:49-648(-)